MSYHLHPTSLTLIDLPFVNLFFIGCPLAEDNSKCRNDNFGHKRKLKQGIVDFM